MCSRCMGADGGKEMSQVIALFFAFLAGMFVGIGINELSHHITVWIGRREDEEESSFNN